jgi:hypothetical protein
VIVTTLLHQRRARPGAIGAGWALREGLRAATTNHRLRRRPPLAVMWLPLSGPERPKGELFDGTR